MWDITDAVNTISSYLQPSSVVRARSVCRQWKKSFANALRTQQLRIKELRDREFLWQPYERERWVRTNARVARTKIVAVGDVFDGFEVLEDGQFIRSEGVYKATTNECGNLTCWVRLVENMRIVCFRKGSQFGEIECNSAQFANGIDRIVLFADSTDSRFHVLVLLPKVVGTMKVCRLSIDWRIGVWKDVPFTSYAVTPRGLVLKTIHTLVHGYVLIKPECLVMYPSRLRPAKVMMF
jgi:hypothetical protein